MARSLAGHAPETHGQDECAAGDGGRVAGSALGNQLRFLVIVHRHDNAGGTRADARPLPHAGLILELLKDEQPLDLRADDVKIGFLGASARAIDVGRQSGSRSFDLRPLWKSLAF